MIKNVNISKTRTSAITIDKYWSAGEFHHPSEVPSPALKTSKDRQYSYLNK